jgi:formylglycine-generating enzyme required for sulfatase activity
MKSTPAATSFLLAVSLASHAGAQGCQGDIVPNGAVNGADLGVLLSYWGPRTSDPFSVASDIDGNGDVNGADLGLLLSGWGNCPASVTSITPNIGLPAGGTQITISGAYLALTTGVSVGGVACTGVAAVDANTVRAVTPPGALGSADVVIAGGAGVVAVPGGFTYQSVVVPSWATLVEAQPDPAVVTDPSLRAAVSATGLAWRVRDTATQIEMLLVPPGTFQIGCIMGSNQHECSSQQLPVHMVTLTQPFYLGRYEVTQAQWQATMGSNPSSFQSASTQVSAAQVPNRPVEQVSWDTIQGYLGATGMRLPTEAEWEYACRAGTQTPFYNGSTDDNTLGALAWYYQGSCSNGPQCQTRPVGGKAANAFGFHDMLGNVWEWVNDWYGDYSANAQTDPTGPVSASNRVLRGGSYGDFTLFVRSSSRGLAAPGSPIFNVGFRVARNP